MNTKTKMIVTLMIVLSMLMVSSAETGTLEIGEIIDGNAINVTVDYDATIYDYLYLTKYYGKYDIEGTVTVDGKTYNTDFNASGLFYTFKDGKIARLMLRMDGKLYQNSEVGFLYEENNEDYYGYIENGYNTGGDIYFCRNDGPNQGGDILFLTGFDLLPYSKYVITDIIPQEEADASVLGYSGNAMGDVIPTLFAYKDPDTGKRVVSETYPTDHTGPVITMPTRIMGEPLFQNDFWTTPKGISILEKKANKPNRK